MTGKIPVLLAAAALMGGAGPRSPTVQQVYGDWEVTDSACAGCSPGWGTEVGSHIVIEPTSVRNPFSVDCAGAIGLEEIRRESVAAMFRRYGLPAVWQTRGTSTLPVYEVRLTCNDTDNAHFVLLSPDVVLMPYEADMVMRLRRRP